MRKSFCVVAVFIFVSSFLFASLSFASETVDLSTIGVGARAIGLGRAYVGMADDGSAIFTNPAGLTLNNKLKLISMSGNLIGEVPYTMVGASRDMFGGVVGVGYIGLGVTGISETILVGGTPEATGNSGSYVNSLIVLSYAKEIDSKYADRVGGNFKLMSQGFSGSSSFEGGNASGFEIDLGAMKELDRNTNIGLTLKNIIPGNNLGVDELGMGIVFGGSKKLNINRMDLFVNADVEFKSGTFFHVGFELKPIRMLSLRLGFDQNGISSSTSTDLTYGLGFEFKGISFDYGYRSYNGLAELGSSFFSIGYTPFDIKEKIKEEVKEKIIEKIEEKKVEEKKIIEVPKPVPVIQKVKELKKKSM